MFLCRVIVFTRYATEKGYWRDEFVKYFCKKAERKSPEISRGKVTHAR